MDQCSHCRRYREVIEDALDTLTVQRPDIGKRLPALVVTLENVLSDDQFPRPFPPKLGEANFHSPEERADLDRRSGANNGNSEESREIQLAQQILAAIKAKDTNTAIRAASALIQIHQPVTDRNGLPSRVLT